LPAVKRRRHNVERLGVLANQLACARPSGRHGALAVSRRERQAMAAPSIRWRRILPIALARPPRPSRSVMDCRMSTLHAASSARLARLGWRSEVDGDQRCPPTYRGDPGGASHSSAVSAQRPPAFLGAQDSGGRSAYDLARAGETVETEVGAMVTIDRLELRARPDTDHADCLGRLAARSPRSGRSAADLARPSTVGHLSALSANRRRPVPEEAAMFASQL